MMHYFLFTISLIGGLTAVLFPKTARKISVAMSMYVWVREFNKNLDDVSYRLLGLLIIVVDIVMLCSYPPGHR